MSSNTVPALFKPIQVGDMTLAHRVVLAPMTRSRNTEVFVPTDLSVEYYKQRASVPGTLLITESTAIAPRAGGQPHVPGLWNDEQVAAWKKVVDAVHEKGSFIYLQLWAFGRAARFSLLPAEFQGYPLIAPSRIPLSSHPDAVPREMTTDEIKDYIRMYSEAAATAVHRVGFDGVEVQGTNGYLVDQFLQDITNTRTDAYGGSVENRARFALEVMDAVVAAVGQTKAAIRLGPWSRYQEMRMADPVPQFSYLVEQLKERFPSLAYIHVIDARCPDNEGPADPEQADFIHKIWGPRPLITTGGYDRASGLKTAEETGQLVGYARAFLANPDLPFRLLHDIPLNNCDYRTLRTPMAAEGYTTYPFSEVFLERKVSGSSA